LPVEDHPRPTENRTGTAGRYSFAPGVGSRRFRLRGSEILEFTFTVIPLLAFVTALVDTGWGIFAKSTMQWAVHEGLRYGITVTGTQASKANSDLTTMVKNDVVNQSLGLLSGKGLSYIHVNFFMLDSASGTLDLVNGDPNGDRSPNIMQVSVDSYPLPALMARIFNYAFADTAPTTISAAAADEIEPSNDPPPMGKAP